jgi:hypothetical protein
MKSRFILFRRAGVFHSEETVTRKQTSLDKVANGKEPTGSHLNI